MRNRELWWMSLFFLLVSALGVGAVFSVSVKGGWLCLLAVVLLGAGFAVFTGGRYRQLRRLSAYLAEVYSGGQPMDIRDSREGELSVLKDDLYKITCVLSQQARLLKKDKQELAQSLENISHQLKTPLTSLYVMTDLMAADDLPAEKRREFLTRTTEQLDRIQWLVTSLLKMSRIDANAVLFKKEPMNINHLIEKAASPLLIPMEVQEIDFQVDCPDEVLWRGDLDWTSEALGNVLKNCVEHTPYGGRIVVECCESPLHIQLTVTDSGCGIPQKDLPHLFERFYKGENSAPDSVGIGLAMAKMILQNQNADVFASNSQGAGACFTIKLYKQLIV